MAKVTLTDVTSGHTATSTLNANNALVEAAIENTLSRDGTTPNQMTADLDMNGNSILNALATGSTDENFTHTGDWVTATAYVVNNLVYVTVATDAVNGGASYICTTAHTSGTFSSDLAANWQLVAARGGAGAGTGDLISTNNLNDVSSASTSRTNLGLGTAAVVDTGVTNGDVPLMDSTGYPAADGSQITGIADPTTTGVIVAYAGTAAPTGYLLCDGAAVNRTTYSTLFALVSTTFGVGDGSTTFNVPDLRGRMPLGLDNLGGSSANTVTNAQADSLGGLAGSEDHTLLTAEMATHTHVASTNSQGAHTHNIQGDSAKDSGSSAGRLVGSSAGTASASNGAHTHTVTVNNAGSDTAHNNMHPYLSLGYIIKT